MIGGNGKRLGTLVVLVDDGWVTNSGGGGSVDEFWVRWKMKGLQTKVIKV